MADKLARKKLAEAKKLAPSPKREKARRLMARETTNAKKSRIYYFLVQQLQEQYGSKRKDSPLNEFIADACNAYLVDHSDIDEKSVGDLEKFVKEGTAKLKSDFIASKREVEIERRRDLEEQMERVRMEETPSGSRRTTAEGERDYTSELDATQWTVLNAIKSVEGELFEAKEKEDIMSKKMKYRTQLDEHDRLYRIKKREEALKARQIEIDQRAAEMASNQKEDSKQEDRGAKVRHERDVRLDQIAIKQRRLQAEKDRKAAEEAGEIERIKYLLEEDRLAQIRERERLSKINSDTKAENERFELIKEAQRQREVEEDLRQQRLAKERAEKEEKRRADEFEALQERQRKFAAKFDSESGAAQRAAAEAEANLTDSLIERKNRADDERERIKQEKRKAYMDQSKIINQQISARKLKEKQDEIEYDRKLGQRFREDKFKEDREKMDAKFQHRDKTARYRQVLDSQMTAVAQGVKDHGALTNLEKNLNRPIIELLNKPNIAKQVLDRVKPPTTWKSQGFIFA